MVLCFKRLISFLKYPNYALECNPQTMQERECHAARKISIWCLSSTITAFCCHDLLIPQGRAGCKNN